MDAVALLLRSAGHNVRTCAGETFSCTDTTDANCILSMARNPELLDVLKQKAAEGVTVINAPTGVHLCSNRYELDILLNQHGIAVPPESGCHGTWVKRGDASAEIKDDIILCKTEDEACEAIEQMKRRGIKSWIRQAHIPGDLVKFYGVSNHEQPAASLFSFSYPTDTGHSKFGLEQANGKAKHFPFEVEALQREAEKISRLTGVVAYGGDAVVKEDGSFFIIDFNDWPTFSSCREAAARAIACIAAE